MDDSDEGSPAGKTSSRHDISKNQENIKDFINFTRCAMRSKTGNLLMPYHVRTSQVSRKRWNIKIKSGMVGES